MPAINIRWMLKYIYAIIDLYPYDNNNNVLLLIFY